MAYKRILTIQDISCVGQCSITVALPVLSACGHETAILPSAVLSTHTTAFEGYTFRDLSDDIPDICRHWNKEGIKFDAVYTGYQGSVRRIDYVLAALASPAAENALKVIDPAMADGGSLYPGFDREFVQAMKKLCAGADYILPNITEACLLTDTPYKENYDKVFIENLMAGLKKLGCKNIIITGVSFDRNKTGAAVMENDEITYYTHRKIEGSCHGTGDLFASAFTGAVMAGKTPRRAVKIASDYVVDCIEETRRHSGHFYGPVFEPLLYNLIKSVRE